MRFSRQIRYFYLRFIRLRGEPHELALGISFGIFAGMMPIMPFQIALAVTLALLFKGSKLTAALGTWVTNPLNWYFLYYYAYEIGASILGVPEKSKIFSSMMAPIKQGEGAIAIIGKMAGAGGVIVSAFLAGGLIMGVIAAVPSYFIFLRFFQFVRTWRRGRRENRYWQSRSREKAGTDSSQKSG